MANPADVHVGDVSTLFKGKVLNDGAIFNPATASVKKLIFKTPNSTVIERDATVTGPDGDGYYYLEYTTVAADITDGLNANPGVHYWQGYVEFADGSKYHTNIETYSVGRNLN
jgi:hypothetical protein